MTEAATTVKTVEHEEASRLPDTSWLWRRVLIFTVCGVMLYITWRISERVLNPETFGVVNQYNLSILRQINTYAYGLLALGLLLYGVGATVTDVAKLITAFLSTRKITQTSAPPPSTVRTPEVEAVTGEGVLPEGERLPG